MKTFEGTIQIRTLDGGAEQCTVKFAHGHVDKDEFAAAAGVEARDVEHLFAKYADDEGRNLTGFTSLKRTTECPEPVTLVFV